MNAIDSRLSGIMAGGLVLAGLVAENASPAEVAKRFGDVWATVEKMGG